MGFILEADRLLVVEGRDEERFFGAFLAHLREAGQLRSLVQILPIGGKGNFRRTLKALRLTPGFRRVTFLGVVRDADEDPKAAFQSVQHALRDAGLPVPSAPLKPAVGGSLRVAVLILPDASKPGALEDLCRKALAQDPAALCVERFFTCLEARGLPPPRSPSKAWIQAFLASRPRPGLRLGEAAEAGIFPWEARAFGPLRAFLALVDEG